MIQKEKDEKEKANMGEAKNEKNKKQMKDTPRPKKSDSGEGKIASKKIEVRQKHASIPASKLKKEENNKKVVETRKAAAAGKLPLQSDEKKTSRKGLTGKGKSKHAKSDMQ